MRRLLMLFVLLPLALPAWADGSPLSVGQSLPGFTETTVSGRPVDSASLKGKPALIWFTNFSDGSVAATADFLDVCRKHPTLQFMVVSLNGPYDAKARDFAARFNIPDNVVIDADGSTVRLFTGTFVQGGVPVYNLFAFGRDGRMTGHYHYPGYPPDALSTELLRL